MRGRTRFGPAHYFVILAFLALLFVLFIPCTTGQVEEDSVGVSLDVEKIEVMEGRQSHYWITLENKGDELIWVDISFEGDYRNHAWVNWTRLSLGPQMKRPVFMTIYAPLDLVGSGTYKLIITAASVYTNASGSLSIDVEVQEEESSFDLTWLYLLVPALIIPVIVGIVTYRVITKMQQTFKVFEVFIVYNDGRLIRHFPESDDKEDDVSISAMFTAIQEFMSESFEYSSPESQGYLSEVVFGDIKVYIERGITFYVALVTKGQPPKDLRRRLVDLREGLEKRYQDILEEWDGNLEPFEDILDVTMDQELEVSFEDSKRD